MDYAAEDTRKILKFSYAGCGGWDLVCSWFLSEQGLARRIAWKLLRAGGAYHGLDLATTRFVIQMPHGSYEVVGYENERATVTNCATVSLGGVF